MAICRFCGTAFTPDVSFANLFRMSILCIECKEASDKRLMVSVLPTSLKEVVTLTYEEGMHPLLLVRLLEASNDAPFFYYDDESPEVLKVFFLAFSPCVLFSDRALTLDQIEILLEALDE